MASKTTVKTAEQLLDRFFRDAEGRTNRQLDVYFTIQDMGLTREKADPALEFLVSRGLLNAFGPDIAFLTELGTHAVTEEQDLQGMPRQARDFGTAPAVPPEVSEPEVPVEEAAPRAHGQRREGRSARPERPMLTHIDLDGAEYALPVGWLVTIGRSDQNDVRVSDQRASKRHAEIRYETSGYILEDLQSANGTLLNGEYIVEPKPLKHDDEIVIGRTMLLFQAPTAIPRPEGPPPSSFIEDPATEIAPTLRPAERPASSDEIHSIRVVKGRPDAPPTPRTPEPVIGKPTQDLFDRPARTLAPSPSEDLFGGPSPDPSGYGDDLFASNPPTGPRGGAAAKDDLFASKPSAGPRGGTASKDDLFSSGSSSASDDPDDLFADSSARSDGADDLFAPGSDDYEDRPPFSEGSATVEAEDLFDDAPPLEESEPTSDPNLEELEPLDLEDDDDGRTFASMPAVHAPEPVVAPEEEDLWMEATPKSEPPTEAEDLLENQPVRRIPEEADRDPEPRTLAKARGAEDLNTVMVSREALFPKDRAEEAPGEDELPAWGEDSASADAIMGSHPSFAAAAGTPVADDDGLEGEALPVATPSLAGLRAPQSAQIRAAKAEVSREADEADRPRAGSVGGTDLLPALGALRAHVARADLPDKDALLDAIDLLRQHPYVRVAIRLISGD